MKNCIAQEHLISSNPNSSKARTSICSQTSTYNFNHFPCLCSLPKLRPKNQCQSPAATHTRTHIPTKSYSLTSSAHMQRFERDRERTGDAERRAFPISYSVLFLARSLAQVWKFYSRSRTRARLHEMRIIIRRSGHRTRNR